MKNVIAGLEEGLNAIAEAIEGGGGSSIVPTPAAADEGKVLTAGDDGTASWENASGGGIPTPTLDDESKVLRVIPQSQTRVAPEWSSIREVSRGGQNGQVLTAIGGGDYEWANASGGGGSITKEFKYVQEMDFNDTIYTNCVLYTGNGSNLSSALVTALNSNHILDIKLTASDGTVTYNNIDCIGWDWDESDVKVYFRKSDFTILDKEELRRVTYIYY